MTEHMYDGSGMYVVTPHSGMVIVVLVSTTEFYVDGCVMLCLKDIGA